MAGPGWWRPSSATCSAQGCGPGSGWRWSGCRANRAAEGRLLTPLGYLSRRAAAYIAERSGPGRRQGPSSGRQKEFAAMAHDFDLFVIGGGSAGVRCARIAAGHGARVGVAEERFWGGTCVNVGCVPKKIMVNAAEYGQWAEDAAAFGWTVEKTGFDLSVLAAARDAEVARLNGIYGRLLTRARCPPFVSPAALC